MINVILGSILLLFLPQFSIAQISDLVSIEGCWLPEQMPNEIFFQKDELTETLQKLTTKPVRTDTSLRLQRLFSKLQKLNCKDDVLKNLKELTRPIVQKSVAIRFNRIKEALAQNTNLHSIKSEQIQIGKLENEAELTPGTLLKQINWPDFERSNSKYQKIRLGTCSTKDFRNESFAKVRDQDKVGWCYSYAAADLLYKKTGIDASPVGIANSFNDDFIKNLPSEVKGMSVLFKNTAGMVEGGSILESLNNALKQGLCLNSALPSNDMAFPLIKGMTIEDGYFSALNLFSNSTAINNFLSDQDENPTTVFEQILKKFFPSVTIEDLRVILSQRHSSSKMDWINQQLIKRACPNPIKNVSAQFTESKFSKNIFKKSASKAFE